MSRSGVGLDDDCVSSFDALKLKKAVKYIIYRLTDDKTRIVVETDSAKDELDSNLPEQEFHEKFLTHLPENDCRWAVYDFNFSKGEGEGHRSKICFISWSPDSAPVRSKMTYASSKDGLRRALNGIAIEIQASDFDEVDFEVFMEKCQKGH